MQKVGVGMYAPEAMLPGNGKAAVMVGSNTRGGYGFGYEYGDSKTLELRGDEALREMPW